MNVRIEPVKRVRSTGTPSLEWMLRTDLDSLRSNLSDNQPSLNQVECLLYLSKRHLEEAALQGKMPANALKILQLRYQGLMHLAYRKFPALVEYGVAN